MIIWLKGFEAESPFHQSNSLSKKLNKLLWVGHLVQNLPAKGIDMSDDPLDHT